MFEQTFVPEAHSRRKPIGIALSVILQTSVLVLLAAAPLFFKQPPPAAQLRLLFLGPRPPVSSVKPTARTTAPAQTSVPRIHAFRLTAPVIIPKQINKVIDTAAEAPEVSDTAGLNLAGPPLLGAEGGASDNVPPPMPKPAAEPKRPAGPVAVGGNVAAANLVHRVEPTYPPLAKSARVQGTVIFQAVIGADGQIRNLQLQEGHPLLIEAARNAILQWRYRPTLLNGKPVEVVTTITVRFALSQ